MVVLEDGTLERCLATKDGTLRNGSSVFTKGSQRAPPSFHHVGTQGEGGSLKPGRGSSPELDHDLDLGQPGSKTVKNKFLLLTSHPIYSILLEQPKQNKSYPKHQNGAYFRSAKKEQNWGFQYSRDVAPTASVSMCTHQCHKAHTVHPQAGLARKLYRSHTKSSVPRMSKRFTNGKSRSAPY